MPVLLPLLRTHFTNEQHMYIESSSGYSANIRSILIDYSILSLNSCNAYLIDRPNPSVVCHKNAVWAHAFAINPVQNTVSLIYFCSCNRYSDIISSLLYQT